MTRILFITSIVLLIVGNIGRIYANNYTYVDADGFLHDTLWLPISALLLVAGFILLVVAAAFCSMNYLRNR